MEYIIFTCPFCNKKYESKNAWCSHKGKCRLNPTYKPKRQGSKTEAWYNAMHSLRGKLIKQKSIFTCEFCNKTWSTTKAGYTLHSKSCNKNPMRVSAPSKGSHISEETRQKLKENAGGYRRNAGRGKRGYYKGFYCMSTWELAWVVYQLEHGKKVEQCIEKFEYIMNDKVHHYTPDFIIDGIYYEIKNWHRPDTDFKVNQFPKDKTLILIEGEENNKYLNYVREKYGENFYDILYEQKDYSDIKKESEYLKRIQQIENERWELIQNSDIDFSKYGWVKKASELFGISENKAGRYIKKHFPKFYEEKCYKQKRGVYPQSDKLQKG